LIRKNLGKANLFTFGIGSQNGVGTKARITLPRSIFRD
jgi:hypothetical protein